MVWAEGMVESAASSLYELPGNRHSNHTYSQFVHQSIEARAEVLQYGWVEW